MKGVSTEPRLGRRLEVTGIVQAVGFRPFVYRLARELGLDGRVRNAAGRVEIEVAGPAADLDRFAGRLREDAPPRARVERVTAVPLATDRLPAPRSGFVIDESVDVPALERLFPPDIATCPDCLREVRDPRDRRYRYPFTNCTDCGPRATIIEDLPYDRSRTSMRAFVLCPDCEREYRDPGDRRFHAEPVACPACGPRLAYRRAEPAGEDGETVTSGTGDPARTQLPRALAEAEDALRAAIADLVAGRIVAVKGLGGYHLACDATDAAAVARLRDRKRRWAKPFAVMVRDLDAARALATVTPEEERLLTSPARPIVLLEVRPDGGLAANVTNGNRRAGIFLPYTPLHHLLLGTIARPIVLTSGNLSDEPLVTDDAEALARLRGLADSFLQHDREIRARYDDSVTRVVAGRESIVRRGRGYAPDPLDLPPGLRVDEPLLAAGAELKHTFTLASGSRAYVSPAHRRPRGRPRLPGFRREPRAPRAAPGARAAHRRPRPPPLVPVHPVRRPSLPRRRAHGRATPSRSRGFVRRRARDHAGRSSGSPTTASVSATTARSGAARSWWPTCRTYRRVARFGIAPMPGGALAVTKPYRMALGYVLGAEDGGLGDNGTDMSVPTSTELLELAARFLARFDPREVAVVRTQIARRLNAPLASSAGRLFDAVASLLGIRDVAEYEAQAAIELEQIADHDFPAEPLPYRIARSDGLLVYDPRPTLAAVLADGTGAGTGATSPARLGARFHETIATVTRELCAEVRRATGLGTVCLSGGVFQNQWLAESLLDRLGRDGFEVHINRLVPVNDGGISYGQAAVAAARLAG